MLGLKLNHVSKRGHRHLIQRVQNKQPPSLTQTSVRVMLNIIYIYFQTVRLKNDYVIRTLLSVYIFISILTWRGMCYCKIMQESCQALQGVFVNVSLGLNCWNSLWYFKMNIFWSYQYNVLIFNPLAPPPSLSHNRSSPYRAETLLECDGVIYPQSSILVDGTVICITYLVTRMCIYVIS